MKVFITRKIPEKGIEILKNNNIEIIINPYERQLEKEEIITYAQDCEAIITLLSDKIDRELIDRLPKMKIIANYAVGYNNIDFNYCREKGIYVTNTPGVLTETTADLGFALILSTARKIPQSHIFTKHGMFKGWEPMLFLGHDVYGKTLGIIGLGRIGQAVAKRASGFSMNVLYYSPEKNVEGEKNTGAVHTDLENLAQKSDFIIITCPLTEKTKHMIDRKVLSKMKQTAILINLARGPIVDEKVLIEFLKNDKIAGAGFDVYENEPEIPDELKNLENVVILPHIGSASYETRTNMAVLSAQAVVSTLVKNEKPDITVW
ncbi:MAG: D-glycerate dehydrogenase, partial [Candidatus Muiribacteriota bacterium]